MDDHSANDREPGFPGIDKMVVSIHSKVAAQNEQAALTVAVKPIIQVQPNQRQRILLAASAGGHWIELARLSKAFGDAECLFLSTTSGLKAPIGDADVIVVPDFSRHNPLVGLGALVRLYLEVRRFDPDVVFSTGAAPGALAILIGKLRGARTIWVDSLANYDALSLSARFVRPFCDKMVTQWPHLASQEKGIGCWGRII